jgi:hypothetical protein
MASTMFIAELEHPRFGEFDLTSLRTGIMAGSPFKMREASIAELGLEAAERTETA